MNQHIDSWKNSSSAFEQQLERNIQELNGQFPPHWIHFVEHVQNTPINRIVDVGCGAGAYCHISTQMGIEYIGYDYSQHAIDLATKTWGGNFICKNYKELTPQDIQTGDIVVANALCDVLPNGDECLRSLLQIGADNLLIQRIRTTNIPSFSVEYEAYGFMTYEFYHNSRQLAQDIEQNSYIVTYHRLYDNIFDLEITKKC